jgi:hypothetical protein
MLSADGSHILYENGASTEIRIVDALGNDSRAIARAAAGERFANVSWAPGGLRIIDERFHPGEREVVLESRAADGGDAREILRTAAITSIAVTRDGRLFYTAPDPPPSVGAALWLTMLDSSGGAASAPQRIAHWPGIQAGTLSASADGRRLITTKVNNQSDVILSDFDPAKETLGKTTRLTTDTQFDWPSGWMPDGNAFVFYSNRGGNFDIFRQPLAAETPEPMVLGPGDQKSSQITADGQSLIYVQMPDTPKGDARVIRMPLAGGPPQVMFETRGESGSAAALGMGAITWGAPGARSMPDVRCPRQGSGPCVLVESIAGQTVFSTFNPSGGKPREIARLEVRPARMFWDLSPDGAAIAYGEPGSVGEKLRVFDIGSHSTREVPFKGWVGLMAVAWSADGQHLFATNGSMRGSTLLYASIGGDLRVLRNAESQYILNVCPSRDGRRLLMGETTTESNGWLIEPK